jgi:archaellin
VVAAVFAYTVLSAGLFSTQKSQEVVYSGLEETQNTLEIKGAVLAEAIEYQDTCEDADLWDVGEGGADTLDAAVYHEGDGSILLTADGETNADDTLGTCVAASCITVATGDTITFWAKLNDASQYTDKVGFAIDTVAANCDSTATSTVLISAADTDWHQYTLTVDAADDGTSVYYGVYVTDDIVATTVNIDDVQVNNASEWLSTSVWTPYATSVILTLGLASNGQPIDFTAGTDDGGAATADGIYDTNDSSKTNKIVVNFNDAFTHVSDVAWSAIWIGNDNGDAMLDPGEKVKVTINLDYINNNATDVTGDGTTDQEVMGVNHTFNIELKSPKGAVLSLERTLPARLYGINNLN